MSASLTLRPLVAYAATAVVFLTLDASWLAIAGPKLYKPEIGALLADKVSIAPAVAFYLLYVAGLVYFCVLPGAAAGVLPRLILSAAFFGVVGYGAYDLTNMATLKLWSLKVTVADLTWGAFASAIGSTAGYLATRAMG